MVFTCQYLNHWLHDDILSCCFNNSVQADKKMPWVVTLSLCDVAQHNAVCEISCRFIQILMILPCSIIMTSYWFCANSRTLKGHYKIVYSYIHWLISNFLDRQHYFCTFQTNLPFLSLKLVMYMLSIMWGRLVFHFTAYYYIYKLHTVYNCMYGKKYVSWIEYMPYITRPG